MINYAKHCINSSSNIYFEYLLESPQRGDSNKYPKHMFYEEIRIKQGFFFYLSFCPLKILYNSKFIIMVTSLGINAVVVTKVHCNKVPEPSHDKTNKMTFAPKIGLGIRARSVARDPRFLYADSEDRGELHKESAFR